MLLEKRLIFTDSLMGVNPISVLLRTKKSILLPWVFFENEDIPVKMLLYLSLSSALSSNWKLARQSYMVLTDGNIWNSWKGVPFITFYVYLFFSFRPFLLL